MNFVFLLLDQIRSCSHHFCRISNKYVALIQPNHESFIGKTAVYFAELLRGHENIYEYNYRISYSAGFRKPSIKELFYNWQDHAGPDIIGNPNLKPTKNNHFSISFHKRTEINDFSLDLYKNKLDSIPDNIQNLTALQYLNIGKNRL